MLLLRLGDRLSECSCRREETSGVRCVFEYQLRARQPGGPDLIARKIGDITGHLYAPEQYLERIGVPQLPEDLGDAASGA